ncbi:hypothetical protein ACHAW5_009037 [Stephanodiscus triporus]|uniref:Serine protease n=1 Tax=Stephanodiscus triporus TaxID=2934178 RepID=A0ABD3Q9G9_9STRA
MPLDLKIDRGSGEAYVSGAGGYLRSYASAFVASSSSSSSSPSSSGGGGGGGGKGRSYWDGMIHLEDVIVGRRSESLREATTTTKATTTARARDDVDATDGLYYELRNGLLRGSSPSSSASGGRGEAAGNDSASSSSSLEEEEEEEEATSKNITATTTTTTTVVVGDDARAMVETKGAHNHRTTKKRTEGGDANNNNKLPRIGQTFPSRGSEIRKNAQTFGARVLPSKVTGSEVRVVYVQLKDENGDASDLLELEKVSGDTYEVTIDGFDGYGGTSWTYGIVAEDVRGKRRYADGISFDIVTSGDLGGREGDDGDDDDEDEEEGEEEEDGPSSGAPMPRKYETDSDWSYGGTVQSATGRILFEFDGSDETYVCTGTVVHDGPDGDTPDHDNGRSIVQTAAHCAYSDALGKFATRAVFVPDQDSTIGKESDYDCDNDRYGCWHLSYAIVAEGWTKSGFPENVPYDYAYYVAYDDPAAHAGGYDEGLTGVLDVDVRSMRVDFDATVDDGEFVFSVGYSADRDPSLRHCAMERTTINGVEWYENYWLDSCAMTGGASGGPWLVDVDADGVGTLISVNSWGFAHKIGMAGPNLRTSSGSLAECLYNEAKDSKDPGSEGGYIVSSC